MVDRAASERIAKMSWGEVLSGITSEENRSEVLGVMHTLTRDEMLTDIVVNLVSNRVPEIRGTVSWLVQQLRPETYVEVGVRRGWSACMAAHRKPDLSIWAFDMWIRGYSGSENPGPNFVLSELRRIGFLGEVEFVSGNSHETLPAFLGNGNAGFTGAAEPGDPNRVRPGSFDMIVIDGDHSVLGAYQDLSDLIPFCEVGGALVFDDINPDAAYEDIREELGHDPHGWKGLSRVWQEIMAEYPEFVHFEFGRPTKQRESWPTMLPDWRRRGNYHPGIAFAIRTR
jgi:predicted O-methyltransferase YrrM